MTLPERITLLIEDAIRERIFPGAVVLVAQGSVVLHQAAYGTTMYEAPDTRPVALDTIYDVASLTKVFTATAALRLYDQGLLDLEAPVAAYLPMLRTRAVLVRHLLTHTSGIDLRLSVLGRIGRTHLLEQVYVAEPQHQPGTRTAYTNINALLLGDIVSHMHGTPLDTAIHDLVIAPLGLRTTAFNPPQAWHPRIAPTEHDHEWRGHLVHGSVHDESAHALGGIAGHAGLFSTADDLLRFCQAWLPNSTSFLNLLQPATIQLAIRNHTAGLELACGLGWMLDRPRFMGTAPPGSFGHTGFTGPAIVIVPQQNLIVVVLCNRIYPRRSPPTHQAIIADVITAAVKVLHMKTDHQPT